MQTFVIPDVIDMQSIYLSSSIEASIGNSRCFSCQSAATPQDSTISIDAVIYSFRDNGWCVYVYICTMERKGSFNLYECAGANTTPNSPYTHLKKATANVKEKFNLQFCSSPCLVIMSIIWYRFDFPYVITSVVS